MKSTKAIGARILGLLLLAAEAPEASAAPAPERYVLMLRGAPCVELDDVRGGDPIPGVVSEQVPGEPMLKKRVGSIRTSEISFDVSQRPCSAFNSWLRDSATRPEGVRMDGSIVFVPADDGPLEQLDFLRAVFMEVQLPQLRLNDKSLRRTISVTIKPEAIRKTRKGVARPLFQANGPLCVEDALLFKSTFLSGAYFDRVALKWSPSSQPQEIAGPITVSDLSITVPGAKAAPLYDWHDEFIIWGRNGDDSERFATIGCPSDKAFKIELGHLGIVSVAKESDEFGDQWVTAKFYIENVRILLPD